MLNQKDIILILINRLVYVYKGSKHEPAIRNEIDSLLKDGLIYEDEEDEREVYKLTPAGKSRLLTLGGL